MPPPTYEDLKLGMALMFFLLLILACLAIEPIDWKRKAVPVVEHCKLHQMPLADCLDQHNEDDPSVDHEPTTIDS